MVPEPVRDPATRKRDVLARLAAPAADVWVATASPTGSAADGAQPQPYLIPLSLAWVGERVVLALQASSRTGRALPPGASARLGLGPTRDVVMLDAVVEAVHPVGRAPAGLAEGYVRQADWDPRDAGPDYVLVVLRPQRIQAWREENELAGRTVMRDGHWLV